MRSSFCESTSCVEVMLKSSFCANNGCVEVNMVKSSFSGGNGNCVNVQFATDILLVTDTKLPQSPVLAFNKDEWEAFIKGVKNNEFDWEVLSESSVS